MNWSNNFFSYIQVKIETNPYSCLKGAHAFVIATEWDEFKGLDYERVYTTMVKPAFAFDGRLILDHARLHDIGFHVEVNLIPFYL